MTDTSKLPLIYNKKIPPLKYTSPLRMTTSQPFRHKTSQRQVDIKVKIRIREEQVQRLDFSNYHDFLNMPTYQITPKEDRQSRFIRRLMENPLRQSSRY